MQVQTHSTRENSFSSWLLAGIVGHLVGVGAIVILVQELAELAAGMAPGAGAELYALIASALAGVAAGVAMGAAQWPTLRRAFDELRVQEWILASALGGALVGLLARGAAAGGPYDVSSLPAILLAALAFGLVAGGIFGGTQAWALRRRSHVAGRWCLANAAGWALGLLLVVAGVLGAVLGPDFPVFIMVTMTASIAALGAVIAGTTCASLRSGLAFGRKLGIGEI